MVPPPRFTHDEIQSRMPGGSYEIIKCPECNNEDTDQDHHLNIICTTCRARSERNASDKKITQVTTEADTEPPAIISWEKVKAQRR